MPSVSLSGWRDSRAGSLREIDHQCAASLSATPANPRLAEENVRGYGLLLSAHFQGYCRDLYTEASQHISSKVRVTLRMLVQEQFTYSLALDHGNPTLSNLKRDFGRLAFKPVLSASSSRLRGEVQEAFRRRPDFRLGQPRT